MTKRVQIYIYGAGTAGKNAYQNLIKEFDVAGFIDSDENKHQQTLHGLNIHPPAFLSSNPNAKVVIASEYYEQIRSQLLSSALVIESQILPLPARMLAVKTFEDDQEKSAIALDILRCCCEVLSEIQVPHYLDAGTLLGMYRDQKLIPWDDDLDLSVSSQNTDAIKNAMPTLITKLNDLSRQLWEFQVHTATRAYGNVPKGAIRSFKVVCMSAENLPSIDFFVKYVGNGNSDHCLASRGISIPSAYSKSIISYLCGEDEWPIPVDAKAYLTRHYGDWRTPNKDWSISELTSAETF